LRHPCIRALISGAAYKNKRLADVDAHLHRCTYKCPIEWLDWLYQKWWLYLFKKKLAQIKQETLILWGKTIAFWLLLMHMI